MSIKEHLDAISKAATGLAEYLALHPDECPQDKCITITDPNGNRLKGFQLCWNEKRKVTPEGDNGDGGYTQLNAGPLVTTLVLVEHDSIPQYDDEGDEVEHDPDREQIFTSTQEWWDALVAAAKAGSDFQSCDEPGRRLLGFLADDKAYFIHFRDVNKAALPSWATDLLGNPVGRAKLAHELVDRFGSAGGTVQDGS